MSTIVAPDGREITLTGSCGYPGCPLPADRAATIHGWEDSLPSVLRVYEACPHHASLFPHDFRPSNLDILDRLGFAHQDLAPV